MDDLVISVEFLVAVGSDADNHESALPDILLNSEGWTKPEAAAIWENIDVDVSCIAPGVRALLRDASVDAKLGLCQLYFRILNSEGCPAPDVFDVFCFTMCWQALREAFATSVGASTASNEDGDGAQASTSRQAAGAAAEWSWEKRHGSVSAACLVTTREHLEGRPEALQSAFDHSTAIMRLTLAHKDAKNPIAQRIASLIRDTLSGLLGLNSCISDRATATALLDLLTPGMYGCATMPRGSDALKPHSAILDATLFILSKAPEPLHALLPAFLENCFLRAPDKAPPRTTLVNAYTAIFSQYGAEIRAQLLHFLAVVTVSPSQSQRCLALQCMESMAVQALDTMGPEEHTRYVDEAYINATTSQFVLAIFLQRCIDKSSTVRAKAMACVSKCVGRLVAATVDEAQRPQWLQAHAAILTGDRFIEFDFSKLPLKEARAGGDDDVQPGLGAHGEHASPPPPVRSSPSLAPQPSSAASPLALAPALPPAMFVWRDAAAAAARPAPVGTPSGTPARTPAPQLTPPPDAVTPAAFAPDSGAGPSARAQSASPSEDDARAAARAPPHVLDLLSCHAADGRAAARKAAVQLVAVLVSLFRVARCPPALQAASLQRGVPLLAALAADTSVSVRRAVLDATVQLTQADSQDVSQAGQQELLRLWAKIVLAAIQDAEAGVHEAAMTEAFRCLLQPAASLGLGADAASESTKRAVARLREFIAAVCAEASSHDGYLRKVCALKKGQLKGPTTIRAFQALLGGVEGVPTLGPRERTFCWAVISEVSASTGSGTAVAFLLDSWRSVWARLSAPSQQVQADSQEAAAICRAGVSALEQLLDEQAVEMLECGFQWLQRAALGCEVIAPLIRLVAFLAMQRRLRPPSAPQPSGRAAAAAASADKADISWLEPVYSSCQRRVIECLEHLAEAPIVPGDERTAALTTAAARALFTVGHLSLETAQVPPEDTVKAIQALTLPSHFEQHAAALSPKLTPGCSSRQLAVPSVLQAHAWAALGKVCLCSDALTNATAPLLVQELARSKSPAVRNNALLALCDICQQSTALVDTHLRQVAACMRDPHPLLRKQALALLAGLLQKEFVKWRGPLFVQYLLSLVDDSPTVRAMAEHLVVDAMRNAPSLAHNHFLEAAFVLNSAKAVWIAVRRQGGRGDVGGSQAAMALTSGCELPRALKRQLSGPAPDAQARRFVIYKVLLRSMQPAYKFALVERINEEVLSAAADGVLPLDVCGAVLSDMLRVLCLKELAFDVKAALPTDESDDAGGISASQTQVAGPMARLNRTVRRMLLEKLAPTLASLRATLDDAHSPLQQPATDCLVHLWREHEADMEDILVSHRQLSAEIRFKAQEAQKAKRTKPPAAASRTRRTTAAAAATPMLGGVPHAQLPMATPCGLPPGAVSPGAALGALAQENAPQHAPPGSAHTPLPRSTPATAGPPDLQPFGSLQLNAGAPPPPTAGTPAFATAEPKTPMCTAAAGGDGAVPPCSAAAGAAAFSFGHMATPASGVTASGRRWPLVRTPALLPGAAVDTAKPTSQRSGPAPKSAGLTPPPSLMQDPQDVCRIRTTDSGSSG
eukprot:jgi/Ulvmu1/1147/UM107_0021.1